MKEFEEVINKYLTLDPSINEFFGCLSLNDFQLTENWALDAQNHDHHIGVGVSKRFGARISFLHLGVRIHLTYHTEKFSFFGPVHSVDVYGNLKKHGS